MQTIRVYPKKQEICMLGEVIKFCQDIYDNIDMITELPGYGKLEAYFENNGIFNNLCLNDIYKMGAMVYIYPEK